MAMKPTMSLKMGQSLRMTPQLQQAIRLLQLSSVDLELEIQDVLDSNFMLEEISAEESELQTGVDAVDDAVDGQDSDSENAAKEIDPTSTDSGLDSDLNSDSDREYTPVIDPEIDGDVIPDTTTEVSHESLTDELPVDTSWEDFYGDTTVGTSGSSGFSDENYLETRNAQDLTLQDHLRDQLNLLRLTAHDQFIATAIVDGIDEDGVLQIDIEDVLVSVPVEWEIEVDEVEAVLHLIQHLDPVGVAARSLQECLTIQLLQMPSSTPNRQAALNLAENFLSQLANRDYTALARKLRIKEPQLKEVIELIQTLDPRPGSNFGSDKTDYVEPDVIVSKQNGRWSVELNPKSAPKIRVNQEYVSLIKRSDTSDDTTHLRNHLQDAKWFLKSLQQRNDTLLRVSTKIVEYQRGFLEYGEQAMKPLVLHDIAEAVDLHESTISRVTTQKYMLTPSGLFELKYFFSSHVSTASGGEVSSTAIRALIKQLVSDEDTRKPLSDSKISNLLKGQNINVARRTIAKYRELLLIPPSNERKQLI